MNRSILLSSIVDLVPSRTAASCWMIGSSCSVNAMNPSSFFASAKVCLPVVLLSFMGGSTPNSFNTAANCLLLANFLRTCSSFSHCKVAFSVPNNCNFSCLSSSSRSLSSASSTSSIGLINIFKVISIKSNSSGGNALDNTWKSLKVNSTSLMQYEP